MDMGIDSQVRLKTKIYFNFPKSKKKGLKKRIALFDLDETLVHCTGDIKSKKSKYQHTIDISLPGKNSVKVGINLRPLWKETLDLIKKKYHIVVHTASHQTYADAVLDFMDPEKKYFKYRLYRNNCSLVDIDDVKFYVKDLDIFNEYYDLKDIVIIDNSVLSFAYHLYNGIPIVPYYEGENDNFLYVVGLYLEHIYKAHDLREANKKLINLDYFYGIAKSQVENAENIIDEESDVIEEGEGEENSQNEIQEENINNNVKGDETFKSKKSRHKSGKTDVNNKGGMAGSYSPLSARKTVKELSENKLMSNSNLFNIYLEMNDNKNKINNHFSLTSKESKKEKSIQTINFSNYAKLVKEDINIINKE
jgi:Dullard-like phosphatase family protein